MARGWESKAIEDQINAKESGILSPSSKLSPSELEIQSKRAALLVARARIEGAMQSTQKSDRREFLQKALTDLDSLLAKLEARE